MVTDERRHQVEMAEKEKAAKLDVLFDNARTTDELTKAIIKARELYGSTRVFCLEHDCEFWLPLKPNETYYLEKDDITYQKGFCIKDEIVIDFSHACEQYVYGC